MHLRDANNAGNTVSQTAEQGGFLYAVNVNAKRIKTSALPSGDGKSREQMYENARRVASDRV
jgi:hypothetical protein